MQFIIAKIITPDQKLKSTVQFTDIFVRLYLI